jgi:hypothetical protein
MSALIAPKTRPAFSIDRQEVAERTQRSTTDAQAVVGRVLTEDVLTLAQARAEIHQITGRRPDKGTICRWVHRGAEGIRLDAVRVGSQLLTSRQALHRFISARTAQSIGTR